MWCVAVAVCDPTWRGEGVGGSKGQHGQLIMMWAGMALHVSGIVKVFSLNGAVGVVVVVMAVMEMEGGGCGRAGEWKITSSRSDVVDDTAPNNTLLPAAY